jgi:hypothetical protein
MLSSPKEVSTLHPMMAVVTCTSISSVTRPLQEGSSLPQEQERLPRKQQVALLADGKVVLSFMFRTVDPSPKLDVILLVLCQQVVVHRFPCRRHGKLPCLTTALHRSTTTTKHGVLLLLLLADGKVLSAFMFRTTMDYPSPKLDAILLVLCQEVTVLLFPPYHQGELPRDRELPCLTTVLHRSTKHLAWYKARNPYLLVREGSLAEQCHYQHHLLDVRIRGAKEWKIVPIIDIIANLAVNGRVILL